MECNFEMNKQDTSKAVDEIMHFIGMASHFLDEEKCEKAFKAAKILGASLHETEALRIFYRKTSKLLEIVGRQKAMEETIFIDENTYRELQNHHGAK